MNQNRPLRNGKNYYITPFMDRFFFSLNIFEIVCHAKNRLADSSDLDKPLDKNTA